jgi:hypothetical protein
VWTFLAGQALDLQGFRCHREIVCATPRSTQALAV